MNSPIKLALPVIFFTLSWCVADAQKPSVQGILGSFQLGYIHAAEYGNVAHTFVAESMPSLSDHSLYSGATGWLRINRFMGGLSVSALAGQSTSWQHIRLQRMASIGQVKLGYVLFEHRQWLIFPSVGQGISATGMTIEQDGTLPETWVSATGTTDFTLHVNRLIARDIPTDKKWNAFWVGLRLGYLFSATSSVWTPMSRSNLLQVKPAYGLHGFYITLAIGGGSFRNGPIF
ncbi:hypothetical protein [Spirosoma koreense]